MRGVKKVARRATFLSFATSRWSAGFASLPAARGCKESFPQSGKRPAPAAEPPDTIDTPEGLRPLQTSPGASHGAD